MILPMIVFIQYGIIIM